MQINWTGKLASIFVKNGKLSLLLVITLFVWGIFSFILTPKQYNPRIVAPAFQVVVEYPGASRTEVLEQVTKPLENIIRDIPEVEDIFSVTYHGGMSVINVNFYVGEDFDVAKITLTDRINSRIDLSPLGTKRPVIRSIDPDDVPILTLALSSDKLSPIELRRFAFELRQRLIQVEGTNNIKVVGGRKREIKVLLDPEKLAKSGIGITEIQSALKRQNLFSPTGLIKTEERYIPLEVAGNIKNPKELENVVVRVGDVGTIRIKDIARVDTGISEVEDYVRHSKVEKIKGLPENVVLISLAKKSNANISVVTESVIETLKEPKLIPGTIHIEPIVNEGRVAKTEINGLIVNLFQAVLIVVAILLVSLDFRAAVLVGISIPLTLASVFGVAYVTGQNINRITLFALILSLGLLVDSATVVIENIVRKLKNDKPRENEWEVQFKMRKVIEAVNEVGVGLFISTVTTVLAFLPMAFVTGMMGPYMGPIPFFVPTALVLALFIAYTINPWLASVFIKTEPDSETKKKSIFEQIISPLVKAGTLVFNIYKNLLHKLMTSPKMRKIYLSVIFTLLLLSVLLPAVTLVKFRMLPKADKEQFFLYIDLPEGTPLEETLEISKTFEKKLLGQDNIVMVQSYVGRAPILDFNGLFRGVEARKESYQATLRVGLTKPDERDISSEDLVMGYRPELEKLASKLRKPDFIKLKLVEDPPGPPVLSTLLVRVTGENEALLENIAKDIYPHIRGVEEVVDTDTSVPDDNPTMQIEVNHVRASQSRISSAAIINTLRTAYAGDIIGIYHKDSNLEQEYIRLQMDRRFREKVDTLEKIYIYNDLRLKVPLTDLVTIQSKPTVTPLNRENNKTTTYIFGDMGERSITYAAIDLLTFFWDYKLHDGKGKILETSLFGATYMSSTEEVVEISIGGEWELTLEVFRDLGIAMGVAVFLVYFVLVAQFGSFSEPLIILSTIPLSLIGVLPGFMFLFYTVGIYFTATSMIGVIALAGIAVNNSIILLEYLNSLKSDNYNLEEALIEAGVTRFRPVMLTTITTMLGSLTIAGDPVWAGLAYAIVFGLGVSSILTLLVFPILYYIIKGKYWKLKTHDDLLEITIGKPS